MLASLGWRRLADLRPSSICRLRRTSSAVRTLPTPKAFGVGLMVSTTAEPCSSVPTATLAGERGPPVQRREKTSGVRLRKSLPSGFEGAQLRITLWSKRYRAPPCMTPELMILLLASVACDVFGQTFFKLGAMGIARGPSRSLMSTLWIGAGL